MPAGNRSEGRSVFIGRLIGTGLALGLCGVAYSVWPDGLLDRPLAQLTLRDIGAMVFSAACVFWAVRWLQDIWKEHRDAR